MQQRGPVGRGSEAARACGASRQGWIRGEPRGRGRRLPSRTVRSHPPGDCSAAHSRGPVFYGHLCEGSWTAAGESTT
eukprot:572999-Alexandrium_andersonii.AAC.1